MDIGFLFISSVIMTIIGFVTTLLFDIDIPKLISDIVLLLVLGVPFAIFMISAQNYDINQTSDFITNYVTTFTNMIPGILIGEIVGSFFGSIVGNS